MSVLQPELALADLKRVSGYDRSLLQEVIDLCMTLFPWAHFRRAKSAVKMHTLLNLCGNIPEFILITEGNVHDVNVLDHLIPIPGAYYVMDRGYLDFERLYTLHTLKAYFVSCGHLRELICAVGMALAIRLEIWISLWWLCAVLCWR